MLSSAIIDLYLMMKKKLKQQNLQSIEGSISEGNEDIEEEKVRLLQLGNLVVIDYIKASLDILLNMKIEQEHSSKHDRPHNESKKHNRQLIEDEEVMYINSSRHGHL